MQTELPGMESPRPEATPLTRAAYSYLSELESKGLLKPHHVLAKQLVIELAQTIGLAAARGRATGVAQAAKQLMEVMAELPSPDNDVWAQFQKELEEVSNAD